MSGLLPPDFWDGAGCMQRLLPLLQHAAVQVWVVGGTVRDALLGRPVTDYDLVAERDALSLGKALARELAAPYYPLDSERGVARIVLPAGQHIDLADLRADSIEQDLRARDFTINALAVPAAQPQCLLDPTGGLKDLENRLIRAAGPKAFQDDPMRILRMVRQSQTLRFAIAPDTWRLAQTALDGLEAISLERVRDELLQVLNLEDSAHALALLDELGALRKLLPRLSIPPTAGTTFEPLQRLEAFFSQGTYPGGLSEWRTRLAADWAKPLAASRPRLLMLKLAGWLATLERPADALEIGARLCLSTREVQHLAKILLACRELLARQPRDALARYLYYQQYGAAGVDGAVLAAISFGLVEKVALNDLLGAWYMDYTSEVEPPPLLSGNDICAYLGIQPGPQVGELLEELRRAQVQGFVRTREDALAFLTRRAGRLK